MSTTATTGLGQMFASFATAARGTAVKRRIKGDQFGETIASARAEVYDAAAELADRMPPQDAAAEMMKRARAAHIRTPPLMNFDSAGVQYISARAWQFCAWQIDPTLPEVAKSWD